MRPPGGVFSWSDASDAGGIAPLLDTNALGGGSCESIAVAEAPCGPLLCASFRSKLAPPAPGAAGQQPRPAANLLYRLAVPSEEDAAVGSPAAAALSCSGRRRGGGGGGDDGGGGGATLQARVPPVGMGLSGHASCRVVTSGAFVRLPSADGGGALAFFTGDEAGNTVAAWDCSSGGALRQQPWPVLEGPVLQVAAAAPQGGAPVPLFGALCSQQLVVCEWVPGGGV
jgi:hypothetical protein